MKKLGDFKDLDPLGYDAEVYANEAYESMTLKKQIKLVIIAYSVYFLIGICTFLLPKQTISNTKGIEASENSTDIVINFILYEKKNYQPFIRLLLKNNNVNSSGVVLSCDYRVDIYRGVNIFSTMEQEKVQLKSFYGETMKMFELKDIEATRIDVHGRLKLISGSYEGIEARWDQFNTGYAYDVSFIFIILSIFLFIAAFLLVKSIFSLKVRVPTQANKFMLLSFIFISIATIPIPELAFFNMFYPARKAAPYFSAACKALFISVSETICWNLYYRDDDKEAVLYRLSYIYTPLLVFILSLENLFSIDIANIYGAFTVMLLVYLLTLPVLIGKKTEEFYGSITHILILFPVYIFLIFGFFMDVERFNKLEVYTRLIVPVSALFLTFIRWPFEDIVVEAEGDDFAADSQEESLNDKTEENRASSATQPNKQKTKTSESSSTDTSSEESSEETN